MGKSPKEMYYASFHGKTVSLYNQYKQLIRKFNAKANVVTAVTQDMGDDTYIAVTTVQGKTYLYKSNGQLIRG